MCAPCGLTVVSPLHYGACAGNQSHPRRFAALGLSDHDSNVNHRCRYVNKYCPTARRIGAAMIVAIWGDASYSDDMQQLTPQEVIAKLGGTQASAARVLGVSRAAVSRWVMFNEVPKLRQYQIAAILAEKAPQDSCQ